MRSSHTKHKRKHKNDEIDDEMNSEEVSELENESDDDASNNQLKIITNKMIKNRREELIYPTPDKDNESFYETVAKDKEIIKINLASFGNRAKHIYCLKEDPTIVVIPRNNIKNYKKNIKLHKTNNIEARNNKSKSARLNKVQFYIAHFDKDKELVDDDFDIFYYAAEKSPTDKSKIKPITHFAFIIKNGKKKNLETSDVKNYTMHCNENQLNEQIIEVTTGVNIFNRERFKRERSETKQAESSIKKRSTIKTKKRKKDTTKRKKDTTTSISTKNKRASSKKSKTKSTIILSPSHDESQEDISREDISQEAIIIDKNLKETTPNNPFSNVPTPYSDKNEFVFLAPKSGFPNITQRPTITSKVESEVADTDLKLEESTSTNDTHQSYPIGINPDDDEDVHYDEDVHSALGRWLNN